MLDKLILDSIPAIFTAFVVGAVGWISWVSRKVNEVLVTLESISESLKQVPMLVSALEEHRREDAEAFARIDERIRTLENNHEPPRERMRLV
jgi:hypothetical protein